MTLVAAASIGAPMRAGAASIFEDVDAAIVLRLDPSAPSRAMGGASGAVFWGDIDGWSNPALLGLARGLRYDYENTDIIGMEYEARRSVLGWGGLGLALAGRPFTGMGGVRLHDDITIEGPFGPPIVIQLDDQVKSWSVGASLSELATSLAGIRGGQPPAFVRFADVALGFGQKDLRSYGSFSGFDVGPATDWGLLVRTGSAFTAFANPCRVDLAYGYSVQSANDVAVSGLLGTVHRPHRHGTAVRLSVDRPALSTRWPALGLQPLLSVGGAWDRVFVTAKDRRVEDETRLGAEIGLANVAYVRFGQGPDGSVSTSGYGFALPILALARVRYDRARVSVPDFLDFSDQTTDRWSLWLDPLAIAGAWRR